MQDAVSEAAPAGPLPALVGEVAAANRPASALRQSLQALDIVGDAASAKLGTTLFESIFYRLPAFPDDDLPAVASRLYARTGRADAAFLLAGLAAQCRLRDAGSSAANAAEGVPARAAAILGSPQPSGALLLALEALERDADWSQSALVFEAVWPRVPPLLEYWVYFRMSKIYDALGRNDASALMATLALQIEPRDAVSDVPHRRLLRFFRDAGRLRDAAELCVRRHALCPEPALLPPEELAGLLGSAGELLLSPPPAGRRDHAVIAAETRAPRPWRIYGGTLPQGFDELLREMQRPPVVVAEVLGAEVLIDGGSVAVFGPDGVPHPDLSVRGFPALVRARLADRPVEEIHLDEAALFSDEFPDANLCHFLLDHVTRIALYRRAGANLAAATMIGLDLRTEYQRVMAERLGIRSFLPVTRQARVRVGRLLVSSNCHNLRHPGHWGADWAVAAIRDLFDLAPRRPARKLLVSREDSQWRRIGNHDEVANFLKPLGFDVIVPGLLPFAEQVAAFRDATHIVAPHGAGLANMLFCAPGTQVLEVFHPHYGTWAYAMLNAALDVQYASMVGRDALSDAPEFNAMGLPREQTVPHAGRDMRVDMDELRRWLTDSRAW